LSDIVIASSAAVFGDFAHVPTGMPPGDGIFIVYSALLGPNRARYLALTGQPIQAEDALKWGMVSEVVEPVRLMARARELGRQLLELPELTLRYTRLIGVDDIRSRMERSLGYGLALEGLASLELKL
jgi:enoyl-CoA hydratase/carnithine racemase